MGTPAERTEARLGELTAEQKAAYQALVEQEDTRQPGGRQGEGRGQGARTPATQQS